MRIFSVRSMAVLALLFLVPTLLHTRAAKKVDANAQLEKRVEATLSRMKLDEKVDLIVGYKGMSIRPMPQYGIPEIKVADATAGVCNEGTAPQYASPVIAASTWNPRLLYGAGAMLGQDCNARDVNIVLGPGVNIVRSPLCGRNSEYLSEDPYLTSELASSFIQGLQANGVGAAVKHFALNNMEWGSARIDCRADERTCHEIYFPAFRAAIEKAQVAAVVTSRNKVNGFFAAENAWLNQRVLREQWGFDGILMSDLGAVHNAIDAANAGLDFELNSVAGHFTKEGMINAVVEGKVSETIINNKVRNILRVIYRFGWDKNDRHGKNGDSDAAHIALREAQEGIVLLKNKGKILPLNKAKKMLVMGAFAEQNVRAGGRTAVNPQHFTSLMQGLKQVMPKVKFNVSDDDGSVQPIVNDFYRDRNGRNPGLKVEYYNNSTLGGKPIMEETVKNLNFNWKSHSPNEEILGTDHFSMRYTGYLRVPKTGFYTLVLSSDDGTRLWLDDELLIDNGGAHDRNDEELTLELRQGRDYKLKVEYCETSGDASLMLGYRLRESDDFSKMLKDNDAVVVTAGFGEELEGEGRDRTWALPSEQVEMIKNVAAGNPNTIVVLYSGGAVDVSEWIDDVKAVIYAGYPGQEGGRALAEIIAGKVNPGGKLTATWARTWDDYPCANNYFEKKGENYLNYDEKLLVGYRHFDKMSIAPVFPFGFGLSYTTFAYSDLKVKRVGNKTQVKVEIKNTGKVEGAEVVQIYVQPGKVEAGEPLQTLRGFDKITLSPGQKKTVTIVLDENAFSTYKVAQKKFTVNPGNYVIKAGASSRDIRLKTNLKVSQ